VDLPVTKAGKLFSSRVPPAACPHCGKIMDGATNYTGPTAPKGGDFSVCIYCAAVLRFTGEMVLAEATREDLAMLREAQPDIYVLLRQIEIAARLCLIERMQRN